MKFKFNKRGIRFRTVLSLSLFMLTILALLWALQLVFVQSFYRDMKRNQTRAACKELAGEFRNPGFENLVRQTALVNGMSIIVFRLVPYADNEYLAQILCTGGMEDMDSAGESMISETLATFVNAFGEQDTAGYIEYEGQLEILKYGMRIEDFFGPVYFYTSSVLVPGTGTVKILTTQLIVVTAICLILSIAFAVLMSGRISKPIVDITAKAEELAKGNLNVTFSGQGYEEVERMADTLNYATGELQKTGELQRDLISNVSHELRTPLTMIKAYAELIRDISGEDAARRQEHLQVILDETDRLKNLVTDILDLSKLQAGVMEYNMRETDIGDIVLRTAENFRRIYEPEGYSFTFEIDDGVEIVADGARMEQVVYNLLSNAVYYCRENRRITVRLARDTLRLDVIDSGVGIGAEDIPYVFDKYYRTQQGKQTRSGSGVGLSIVKNILKGHGFSYGVTSAVGEGSDFFVVFQRSDKK